MSAWTGDEREWLETDGLGGFASGTVNGVRTRRYHGLLLVATAPPVGRMMLVNGFDAWVEIGGRRIALTSHRYVPGVIHPDGRSQLVAFSHDPWPRWTYTLDEAGAIVQEVVLVHDRPTALVAWTLQSGAGPARLVVRPLLSGRDYHALHRENPLFDFEATTQAAAVTWAPYAGVPAVHSTSNGAYRHDPLWYRQFEYTEERARGLDHVEDLASPGELSWALTPGRRSVWMLSAQPGHPAIANNDDVEAAAESYLAAEARRRAAFTQPLERAADAYIVRRGLGRTIVAGYPWFTDWGRDTFIALRGLALTLGRLEDARDILLEWSGAISEGMVPNRFPDAGAAPEFNAVDASLWFIVAAYELERAAGKRSDLLPAAARRRLRESTELVLVAYDSGTRYGIHRDEDGLLAAGEPGAALTWMDARIDDVVVTPRVGKPVEVNALWLNALRIAGHRSHRWRALYEQGRSAFVARFWNESAGALYDVIDVDHDRGVVDVSLRPNQIFAVGGLPFPVVPGRLARRIVETVEQHLLTPLGLRTLAPGSPGYVGRYEGEVRTRDAAYHQGTVWPWLLGPFVEAWLRVHGDTRANRVIARRFLDPLRAHLGAAGLGHVSEIADAEPPFVPRGCPFQAWSLGELLRLDRDVLGERDVAGRGAGRRRG
ncbi:MAG: glycogen debranching enzyme family protein [Acidobacteria bacterium]|nr:glycogen debranching enzyme family protein [Acidobacteriota bacterium]